MGNKPLQPSNPIQSQYFSLITTHLLQLESSHLSNPMNTQLATEKRSFKLVSSIRQTVIPTITPKPIYWKDYLLSYFISQAKEGLCWYEEVINDMNSAVFVDDAHYLSPLLFREFESATKPNCIDNDLFSFVFTTNYTLVDNPNFEKEIFVKLRSNSTRDGKLSYLNTSTFKPSRTLQSNDAPKKYGGSLCSLSLSEDSRSEGSAVSASEKQKKDHKSLYSNIKDVISLFKRDLQDSAHPIRKVISIFENQLTYVIDETLATLRAEDNNEDTFDKYKMLYEEIIRHVREFVIKAQSALKLFYAPVVDLNCFSEEKDQSINLIMSCLFNTGSLYEKVCALLEIIMDRDIREFAKKLKDFKHTSLKGFGIPERFRLNDETEELMNQMRNRDQSDANDADNEIQPVKADDIIIAEKLSIIQDDYDDNTHNSYESVIAILKNVKTNKKPFEKLLLLASMGSEIPECVNAFWKQMDRHIPQQFLSINSDDLLAIVIYVVVKAQFPEILLHNEIINSFTTDNTKSSMVGYYFITVQTAIEYINNSNK